MFDRAKIEAEIHRRAEFQIQKRYLDVDYYRIRKRVSYPLPVRQLYKPEFPVRGLTQTYPWHVWSLWALEERVHSLAWSVRWSGNVAAQSAVLADLDALAEWSSFRQYDWPDLSHGHAVRLLWAAYQLWSFVPDELRSKIKSRFAAAVEDILPASELKHGKLNSKSDVLDSSEPFGYIHNIPIIGTIGSALAAHVIKHPAGELLNYRLSIVLEALLDMRTRGATEGLAYDGYVLDFVCDWLGILPQEQREKFINHPQFERMLHQSYMLAAPGEMVQVAQLSDVEPREMTFHISAQAKCMRFLPSETRRWYLQRCRLDWLQAPCLGELHSATSVELHSATSVESERAPAAGALDAHYARVLRTGWESADVAAAMSVQNCPTGHMHYDNGSIVIGTAGQWILADPGYQQYLATSEREYSLGQHSHNVPIINGQSQNAKQPLDAHLSQSEMSMDVELRACYPAELNLESVRRKVQLVDGKYVIVRDTFRGKDINSVKYCWHGHAEAAWWCENGIARIQLDNTSLWIASPNIQLQAAMVDRQRGSRGQLTLMCEISRELQEILWVFALTPDAPNVRHIMSIA